MATEIELKARLIDHEAVKERLSALGNFHGSFNKIDSYWFSEQTAVPTVRVRRENRLNEGGTAYAYVFVTCKTKEISGGIEINDEREFTVSDAGLFEEMLGWLGLHKSICKEKNGWVWAIPAAHAGETVIHAEISLVSGLGWFLELEIIAADHNAQTLADSRKRLFALLEKLEIPVHQIEDRPYTSMLEDIAHGRNRI